MGNFVFCGAKQKKLSSDATQKKSPTEAGSTPDIEASQSGNGGGNGRSYMGIGDDTVFVVGTDPNRKITGEYELGRLLGVGAFSQVFLCKKIFNGVEYACKTIDKVKMRTKVGNLKKFIKRLNLEVSINRKLTDEGIVQIVDVFESQRTIYIVMELMKGGELFDYIIDRGQLTEREAVYIIRNINRTLVYMHKQGIAHRDLKPENLMLSTKASFKGVKLIDFGMSKCFHPGESTTRSHLGTPGYMAPEIMTHKPYNELVDIWSLGTVAYILLCGYMPFDDSHGISCNWKTDYPYDDWSSISKEAQMFIDGCLTVDPKKRMTSIEAANHPWLRTRKDGTSTAPATPLQSPKRLKERKSKEAYRHVSNQANVDTSDVLVEKIGSPPKTPKLMMPPTPDEYRNRHASKLSMNQKS